MQENRTHDLSEIDVCLVAGRRPDLLARTLESFDRNLFRNFKVLHVFANIDPIFGNDEDHYSCIEVILNFFPDALISTPDCPGFTAAVRRNWSQIIAPVTLHLEDDWLLQRDVKPIDIAAFREDKSLGQICFNHADKRWPVAQKGPYAYGRKRLTFLGIKTPFKSAHMSIFTTSPSFLRGTFARQCAGLMNEKLDPEKQFYSGVNPPLEQYAAGFRSMVIGDAPDYPIVDIGRDWRNTHGISKKYSNWQPIWIKTK
jgi:hypothetical protein